MLGFSCWVSMSLTSQALGLEDTSDSRMRIILSLCAGNYLAGGLSF